MLFRRAGRRARCRRCQSEMRGFGYPKNRLRCRRCAALGTSVTPEGVAHSCIARAGRWCGPTPRPPEPGAIGEGLGCGRGGPEKAGQLSGARDDDHVVGFAASLHPSVDAMDALLRSVGALQHMFRLSLLTVLEGRADPWLPVVMPRRFDQQPACEAGPSLGDRALARDPPDWVNDGVSPSQALRRAGFSNRCQSAPSSRWIDRAVSVSTPRNALSRATVGQNSGSTASSRDPLSEHHLAGGQPINASDQVSEHERALSSSRAARGRAPAGSAWPRRSGPGDRRRRRR